MRCYAVLLLACSLLVSSLSAATPPQDQFLQLFLVLKEGENLEADGQKASARTRFEEVDRRLQALKKEYPDWEPSIVAYREKYVREKLTALEGATDARPQESSSPTPLPTPAPQGSPDALPPVYHEDLPAVSPETKAPAQPEDPAALKKRIAELESDVSELKKQLAGALADAAQLRAKLDITEKQLAAARSNTVDEKVATLLQENNDLKAQLAQAETQIKTLQAGDGAASVPLLQAQLKKVQEQLALQEQQNESFKQTTAELKTQLEEAQRKLMEAGNQTAAASSSSSFARENEVLRSIVNRMLQEQARRDAAKKLAAEELDNLKVKSEILRRQIDILGSPLVALTDEERSLLRTPADPTVVSDSAFTAPLADGSPAAADAPTEPAPSDFRNKPRVPEDMRTIAQEASDLYANKRYDEACAAYEKIIEKYPESLYAWSNLGVVRFQQQKFPEAQRALQQSIKLAPSDAFSHSILGIVYYQTAKYDEAVSTLTRAAALDPKDAKTRNYLGIACSQKGWQEAAEQECRKAIELDPNYGDAHFNLAVIYATQKPPAKELARRHYKMATDLGIPKDSQLEKMLQ
jgi:Flp pilus assembly protein TadD